MNAKAENLNFVTINGLLSYGEALVRRPSVEGAELPPAPGPSEDRPKRVLVAMTAIRAFVHDAQKGFADAAAYGNARHQLIQQACGGDDLVFFAAWNQLLAQGELSALMRAPIGATIKPTRRRPVAIVPREHMTPNLAEGRIVLDIGNDQFWLMPKDLSDRTLFLTMRHGVSQVDSKKFRVGRRLKNVLDPERGIPKAEAIGTALARTLGLVGKQLDFLHLHNYLDPKSFVHMVSRSPNTRQLFERVVSILSPDTAKTTQPIVEGALESQDFGWATGIEKTAELEEAAKAFGVDTKTAQRLIKHPLYSYPGGHSFFELYVDLVDGFHHLGQTHQGEVLCLYTHSSTLRALLIFLDPRPFSEAFSEFGAYKEGQDNVVLLTFEHGQLSGYSTAVGLSERERAAREAWKTVEQERRDKVTLHPRQIRRVVALVSGGDFAGAGAALKELRVTGNRLGLEVYFVQHGFLGLANNWIELVTEQNTRGMSNHASSPIGSSRFEDFKDEEVQLAAIHHLKPYMEDGALVVMGGDGSMRGARAIFERFGIQVIGIPGSIDDNIAGTTSLGLQSAVALANQSIESLKATSAAMGSVFFVEVMGAGSGHLALMCAYQARAEGLLVNEHPDPDAYIEEVILGTLKQTLGVQNKSHIIVVAERTPHCHHPVGGVHGLVDYVANRISQWTHLQTRSGSYPLSVATKATILGHTLRGASPTPVDKTMAQHLAYEAIRSLVEQPQEVIGCMLAYRDSGTIQPIPLHALAPKPFDWELFARMHGTELAL
ncbi:6-phosphofructokinase [Candidatus Nitronereus thalassa]|uniref:6-phosphofructokinase n=1 Tax=Candidatus Nitronereus thalassa TaxID=3020898 RepID=A0ABU3KDR2_9BACT|nr:6-phosphofructokinase [Candidatus Nitronereus thalassa]MDT7044289.1 6-phosphofructokinase [Candidatus Nitronereus thalassa]